MVDKAPDAGNLYDVISAIERSQQITIRIEKDVRASEIWRGPFALPEPAPGGESLETWLRRSLATYGLDLIPRERAMSLVTAGTAFELEQAARVKSEESAGRRAELAGLLRRDVRVSGSEMPIREACLALGEALHVPVTIGPEPWNSSDLVTLPDSSRPASEIVAEISRVHPIIVGWGGGKLWFLGADAP